MSNNKLTAHENGRILYLNKTTVGNEDPPEKFTLANYRWEPNDPNADPEDFMVTMETHEYALVKKEQ